MPEIKEAALESLALALGTRLTEFQAARSGLEQLWLRDIRQYRGEYDPKTKALLTKGTRSQVYPKDTRVKVVGFVAKLMELMFPASDKNYAITPTPFPNIAQDDLETIIRNLQAQVQSQGEAQAAQAQEQGPPAPQPPVLTSEMIEQAVYEFAKKAAVQMEKECDDHMAEMAYPQLCKKVVRSGGIYGLGLLEGPLVKTQSERRWELDPTTGQYVAVEKKLRRPYFEFRKVWDFWPDLTARTWDEQIGCFSRYVMTKGNLADLKKRGDFKAQVISEFIRLHPEGNYQVATFERDLQALNNGSERVVTNNRYEAFRWYGFYSVKDLKDAGVAGIKEDADGEVLADIWLLGDKIIKADLAPFGDKVSSMFHAFVYEDDEDSGLTGVGLPRVVRDSQLKRGAIDRAMMDNMAATAGPITEVNVDLLAPNETGDNISAFRTIKREGTGPDANVPAVRVITFPNHIPTFLSLRQAVKEDMDIESNLQSWMMGNAQPLGEAFRTSNNMSMMTGGANMVTKDTVRAFDAFTSSVLGSLVSWFMEFSERDEIKGDYRVQARGNISLVAKEVRGAALDQLWLSMTPEEKAIVKVREILIERFKARDLPAELVESEERSREILDQMAQAAAQAQATEQGLTDAKTQQAVAKAKEILVTAAEKAGTAEAKNAVLMAQAALNVATAKGVTDGTQLEHLRTYLDQINQGKDADSGKAAPRKAK
jgi:hypothetical protein